jgi:hypothetical protein
MEIIRTHREAVQALTERLLDVGEMDGAAVRELLDRFGPGPATALSDGAKPANEPD